MGFGATLKAMLEARNLTVTELAQKTGINKYRLYATISRDSQRFDPALIAPIADALNLSVDDMLKELHFPLPDEEKPGIDASAFPALMREYITNQGGLIIDGKKANRTELNGIIIAVSFAIDLIRTQRKGE